jgi:hypothetical protein
MQRAARILASVVALVVLAPACGGGSGGSGTGTSTSSKQGPRWALFYGDSLGYEALPMVKVLFAKEPGWRVDAHAYPGLSLCQQLDSLGAALDRVEPAVVTIETVGSNRSPCMKDASGNPVPRGSDEYYRRIEQSFRDAFRLVTSKGAHVVLVLPPPLATAESQAIEERTAEIAQKVAGDFHGVSISSKARDALGGTTWSETLPCLPQETAPQGCRDGRIVVRGPDRLHFCPLAYSVTVPAQRGCPVYSSGALRLATAIVAATVDPPPPVRPA